MKLNVLRKHCLFTNTSFKTIKFISSNLGGHICWWNGTKWRKFIEDLISMPNAKFGSIWPSCFRGED